MSEGEEKKQRTDMSEDWKTAKLPTLYVKAAKAMIACASLDECKDWKSKMNAAASYARQVNDTTMMDKAVEIRNRARRRMGEILAGTDRVKGVSIPTGGKSTVGRNAIAREAGISEYDRKTALRVAALPHDEFERRVKEPGLGMQKGQQVIPPGTVRCPHCGKVIVL